MFSYAYAFYLKLIQINGNSIEVEKIKQITNFKYSVLKVGVYNWDLLSFIGASKDWLYSELSRRLNGKSNLNEKILPNFYQEFLHNQKFTYTWYDRTSLQLPRIINILQKNSGSHSAILNLWDSKKDLDDEGLTPSTILAQYYIENGSLNSFYFSRSSNCLRFLPVDFFFYSEIQKWIADKLNILPGTLSHAGVFLFYDESDSLLLDEIFQLIYKS